MNEVLEKQRKALVDTIKEANKKETQRIKRLSTVKNVLEQRQLLDRYDRERARDQEHIEYLSKDFFALQNQAKDNDQIATFVEKRREFQHTQPIKLHGPTELLPNRFAGLEEHVDMIFHVDVVKKFDRYDHKFEQRQNRVPYNPANEVKKMRLLQEKKNLLTKLIQVQQQETKASMPASQYIAQRRASDTYSVSSGSTGVSYATFANSAAPSQPSSKRSGPPVPRLNLSR